MVPNLLPISDGLELERDLETHFQTMVVPLKNNNFCHCSVVNRRRSYHNICVTILLEMSKMCQKYKSVIKSVKMPRKQLSN